MRRCVSGIVFASVLACGDDTPSTDSETGGRTSSTSDDAASTTSPTNSATSTSTADDSSTADGSPGERDECQVASNNCPAGFACCQYSFYDPMVCVEVTEGQCAIDRECPRGFSCDPGSTHCPIGECVPLDDPSTTDATTGDDTSSGSSTADTDPGSSTSSSSA